MDDKSTDSNPEWYEYPESSMDDNSDRDMSIEELENYYKNLWLYKVEIK